MRVTGCLVFVAGCALLSSGPPPKCEEVPIELFVKGDQLLNVNVEGQSMPVEVRVYFLGSRDPIENADFDAVWQKAEETLGGALLGSTTFTVVPGQEKISTVSVPPKSAYVGFVALFRRIEGQQWRRIVDVRPAVEACKPGDLHIPVRASLKDNRVIAQERVE